MTVDRLELSQGATPDPDKPSELLPQKLPPVGWWVRVDGDELAQVTKHFPHGAYVEGKRHRGGPICGVYPDMVPLTKEEMLKEGRSWTS